jgi:hypothetical protein
MKNPSLAILALAASLSAAASLTSCYQADASAAAFHPRAPENGAQFSETKGLTLTDEMKKSLGLQVADVGEEKVASAITLNLTVLKDGQASGWLDPANASEVKPGTEVELKPEQNGPALKGTVQRVEPMPFGTLGDYEVVIAPAQPLPVGARVKATIHAPAAEAVTAIPRSALLTTAEGTFVYAFNDSAYVRTPVKTAAMNDSLVAITDGLYSGDQIVTSPVMSLWMAELQVLRGGKACTCGH